MKPLNLFNQREILAVSELVRRVKKTAEERFDFIWVEGEISGLRRPGSGHSYFTLKDDKATLRAVLFARQASLVRHRLEEGAKVLCQGRLTVYEPRGDLQLVVETLEPRGAGDLALAFERTKRMLEGEGVFDQERKQPLPDLPQRIAVITSPTGAAVRDFIEVLYKEQSRAKVAVYPTRVQGESAAKEIAGALSELADWGWPQIIVITRGGGSPEDLAAFNDAELGRAAANSPIPVISAVGHEIDISICDLAADIRAATPTAAAELLASRLLAQATRLEQAVDRLERRGGGLLENRRLKLAGLVRGLSHPGRRIADKRLRIDDLVMRGEAGTKALVHGLSQKLWSLRERLNANHPGKRLSRASLENEALKLRLANAAKALVQEKRARLEKLSALLSALGPQAVLNRGYALVSDENGNLITDSIQVGKGSGIKIRLAEGGLYAIVEGTQK